MILKITKLLKRYAQCCGIYDFFNIKNIKLYLMLCFNIFKRYLILLSNSFKNASMMKAG